jgi:phosphopantetheine adenylyltransferase
MSKQCKSVHILNADEVRTQSNDWDFSIEGRLRQGKRMAELAATYVAAFDFVICDLVAPLCSMRQDINADWVIWVDTIESSIYEDTNSLFTPPLNCDIRVTTKDATAWAETIGKYILDNLPVTGFNPKKPTVQMLGRWQPWHLGHRALFERALAKTGQVCIMVRDCQGTDSSNPFSVNQVIANIHKDLAPKYTGKYVVQVVPNIVNITYGRNVGYAIEQETFDSSITEISATKIREEMANGGYQDSQPY